VEEICILLSNDREFSEHLQTTWTSLFDHHLLPLTHPDSTILNQVIKSSRYRVALIIVDESLIMHGQKDALDQFVNEVSSKFPHAPIVFTFEYSWQFFHQLSKDSIPIPKNLGLEFLSLHLRRILATTVITSEVASAEEGLKNLEELLVAKQKESPQAVPEKQATEKKAPETAVKETVELRNMVKSALYELLPEIEKNQISLKITLPDKDLWVHASKLALKEFLIAQLGSLLKSFKSEEYAFIEVKAEVSEAGATLKILHTEVSSKSVSIPKNLTGSYDNSITSLNFFKKGQLESTSIKAQKTRTVLVIEDEVILLEMIQSILESRGFEVRAFQFSEEALEAVQRENFDMILTDINIPRVSGIQVMDKIRQSKLNKDAKIIVMTGIQNEFTLAKIQEMQPDGFLTKPFTIEALMEQMQRIFGSDSGKVSVQQPGQFQCPPVWAKSM